MCWSAVADAQANVLTLANPAEAARAAKKMNLKHDELIVYEELDLAWAGKSNATKPCCQPTSWIESLHYMTWCCSPAVFCSSRLCWAACKQPEANPIDVASCADRKHAWCLQHRCMASTACTSADHDYSKEQSTLPGKCFDAIRV